MREIPRTATSESSLPPEEGKWVETLGVKFMYTPLLDLPSDAILPSLSLLNITTSFKAALHERVVASMGEPLVELREMSAESVENLLDVLGPEELRSLYLRTIKRIREETTLFADMERTGLIEILENGFSTSFRSPVIFLRSGSLEEKIVRHLKPGVDGWHLRHFNRCVCSHCDEMDEKAFLASLINKGTLPPPFKIVQHELTHFVVAQHPLMVAETLLLFGVLGLGIASMVTSAPSLGLAASISAAIAMCLASRRGKYSGEKLLLSEIHAYESEVRVPFAVPSFQKIKREALLQNLTRVYTAGDDAGRQIVDEASFLLRRLRLYGGPQFDINSLIFHARFDSTKGTFLELKDPLLKLWQEWGIETLEEEKVVATILDQLDQLDQIVSLRKVRSIAIEELQRGASHSIATLARAIGWQRRGQK